MTAVPAALDRIIGRETDLAALLDLLEASRLGTIIGAGGTGKTRLALEAGRLLQERLADGAIFVDLSPLRRGDDILPAIAAAAGLPSPGSGHHALALSWALAPREALILLDNCEHLIADCARASANLLARCPGLRILATSREPLGVPGERIWPLEPLPLPEEDARLDEIAASPAVQLFLERARARRPMFTLNEQNARAVAALCRRVDGLPLAIELSAARLGALTLEDLVTRSAGASLLQAPGSRAGPSRHHTLEAAIAWSYRLLPEEEQTLLRLLGVFHGGAALTAVEAVSTLPDTAALLESLVAKSLVTFRETAIGGRYALLEAIRLYAAAQLEEAGETEAAATRHARYYLGWANDVGARVNDPAQIARMSAERENLRAALRWFDASNDADRGLHLTRNMHQLWILTGHIGEGRSWVARFLPRATVQEPRARAALLLTFGALALLNNDANTAIAELGEAVTLFAETGDTVAQALALNHLSLAHRRKDDTTRMAALLDQALLLLAGRDEPQITALAHVNRVLSAIAQGEITVAQRHLDAALALAHAHGLAYVETVGEAHAVLLALARGDQTHADMHLEAAIALSRQTGAANFLFPALIVRAHLERQRGKHAVCLATLDEALAYAGVQGIDDWLTFALEALVILAATVLPEAAATIAGLRDSVAIPFPADVVLSVSEEFEEAMQTITAALGPARTARLRERGRSGVGLPALRSVLDRLRAETVPSVAPRLNPGPEAGASATPLRTEQAAGGRLSPREADVLRGVIAGQSTAEIARALSLSPRTVERHLQNIYAKIGARGRADAITWGLSQGFTL